MRKILFAIMALAAVTACSENEITNIEPATPVDQMEIRLYITTPGIELSSRSFLDDVSVMNEWESNISWYYIYIFDKDGKLIKNISSTVNYIDQRGYLLITMTKEYANTECTFYVSANAELEDVTSLDDIMSRRSPLTAAYYNSSLNNILSGTAFKNDFPFAGVETVTLNEYGYMTFVNVELTCLFSKVAMELSVAADFPALHNGSNIRITQVKFVELPSYSYFFEGKRDELIKGGINHNQIVSADEQGIYHNVFYSYETSNSFSTPYIQVTGVYDKDGDFTTQDDWSTINYIIPLSDFTPEGELERGICYRIKGVIRGLGDNNIESAFITQDWVLPPVTEMPSIGL